MARAEVSKGEVEVTLTLNGKEARALYDILGEVVYGPPRPETTSPIFDALAAILRDLPEQFLVIDGRVDLQWQY